MHYSVLKASTVQRITGQYSTVQNNALQYSAVPRPRGSGPAPCRSETVRTPMINVRKLVTFDMKLLLFIVPMIQRKGVIVICNM